VEQWGSIGAAAGDGRMDGRMDSEEEEQIMAAREVDEGTNKRLTRGIYTESAHMANTLSIAAIFLIIIY
jgi:hypothetical protein